MAIIVCLFLAWNMDQQPENMVKDGSINAYLCFIYFWHHQHYSSFSLKHTSPPPMHFYKECLSYCVKIIKCVSGMILIVIVLYKEIQRNDMVYMRDSYIGFIPETLYVTTFSYRKFTFILYLVNGDVWIEMLKYIELCVCIH